MAVVKISVDETGTVDKAEVVSGDPILAASCAEALRQWKFKPFITNGRPIRVSASQPCSFVAASDAPPIVPVKDMSDKYNLGNAESATRAATDSTPSDSTALMLIKKVKATYPLGAEIGETQGEVVVKLLVNESGDVSEIVVVSGDSILAHSVSKAVKKWKFEPFIRNGKPIQVSTVVHYDFAFKDKIVVDKLNETTSPGSLPAAEPNASALAPGPPQAVRVSGGVMGGLCIYKVAPVYPVAAKSAHIQGAVVLAAVIGNDGRIKSLRVLSGQAQLADAAVGAVQQWKYRPYLRQGNPIEVNTTITVNFVLNH